MDEREELGATELRAALLQRIEGIPIAPLRAYQPVSHVRKGTRGLPRLAVGAALLVVAAVVSSQLLADPGARDVPAGSAVVAKDLDALARMSDLIVVGTVTRQGGTRNLARDPNNPSQPDSTLTVTGQDYVFVVDEVLKGTAGGSVTVTSARSGEIRKGFRTATYNYETFVPLTVGGRYVLLLRSLTDVANVYALAFEPSRFELGQTAHARSNWPEAELYFPDRPADEFLRDLRTAIARQRIP